ncbi:MAG: prepilin-type N-terminal cleavage/methylation domain-containing protein [Candidatus Marinimicrobia bacterium]|nr:prepilin-type N-terminal cleavage/methylation domain-containing protein [Candidatus Neomarinimicrobiota bacterium]MCF7904820.1 prepilin-type N-terminal cleavage/methylation domain-containing protein [Candidatus Neomarinimicrobiota bacterium]
MKKNSGFSLVELMIVIVIIGVLAAVAVPIYSNNVMKAKMSEADASLGSIRTQLRLYYGENGEYPTATDAYVIGESWHDIKTGELTGKYFSDSSYTITSDAKTYTITCDAGEILTSDRTLDETGTLAGGLE